MPRSATRPRYWPSKGGYGCWHRGQQHMLALGELCPECEKREKNDQMPRCPPCAKLRYDADLRFAELIHNAQVETAEDNSLVVAVCNRYQKWVKEHRKPKTVLRCQQILAEFCDEAGHVKIKELKPFHVEDWLAKKAERKIVPVKRGSGRRGWGPSSRRTALTVIMACLNYAVKKGFVTKNPLAGKVDMPDQVSRSKNALISPADYAAILAEQAKNCRPRYYPSHGAYYVNFRNRRWPLARGPKDDPAVLALAEARLAELGRSEGLHDRFSVLVRFLHHTGARPGEIYNATAADWDDELAAFVYPACAEPEKAAGFTHKTARKGKDRVVFVTDPELVEIARTLCRCNPKGAIFRNHEGGPWNDNSVWQRLEDLKKSLNLNPAITPYSFRHTSITDMVMSGQPLALVAEVHGTSVQMIERFYSHPDAHRKTMARWVAQVRMGREGASAGTAQPAPGGAGGGPALKVVAG